MDPGQFYGAMLDYVESLWCALNVNDLNRGSVVTFGQQVLTQIPLQQYTQDEWFTEVERIRSDETMCCKCCTPTAEAFRTARLMLAANPSPDNSGIPVTRIVFVITDGDPWQNVQGTKGSANHPYLDPTMYYLWPTYKPGQYRYTIVPSEADKLKNMDTGTPVRIMLVGVPNKFGTPPRQEYFAGVPNPALGKGFTQCISRGGKRDCVIMKLPPFPIVSLPLNSTIFNTQNWNVGTLIKDTVDNLCEIIPTIQPTTRSPSSSPTDTAPTSRKPSASPSRAPSHSGPTRSPTKKPTKRPTQYPTLQPTSSPTTSRPTLSPTPKQIFNGLDLYLFLDRSKSMRWRASDCRKANGSNPLADNNHVCWQLFLWFAQRLVERSTELKYDGLNEIGWQNNMADKTKGLRVWIYGFACADQQTVPLIFNIGERVNSSADFYAAMSEAALMTPDGGTCPGAAIEKAVGQIQEYDLMSRPYKAALILTDGVFYDMPRPEQEEQGLFYFGVLTYSVGVGVADNGNNQGLSPADIKTQASQLLAFADNDPTRVKNLINQGLGVLDDIASALVNQLPVDVAKHYPRILIKPYWCGYWSNERCLNTDPTNFPSYLYCNWIPNNPNNFAGNGVCVDKCPSTDPLVVLTTPPANGTGDIVAQRSLVEFLFINLSCSRVRLKIVLLRIKKLFVRRGLILLIISLMSQNLSLYVDGCCRWKP